VGEDQFAGWVAEQYDELTAEMAVPEVLDPAVELLASMVPPGGRALELGIGTGRVAVALAAGGVEVHGIDLSPDMVDRLRVKAGAEAVAVTVTVGDMATTRLDRSFDLVFVVFNTILNLTTQDGQVACFANAARHLRPGGRFVVEAVVPPWRRLPPGQTAVPFTVSDTYVGFDDIDVVTQRAVSHHLVTSGGRTRRLAMPIRYAWPAELDLMARLAGLGLRDRWADWARAAFTADSTAHVSVWQRTER
jgi:SAM-dependent methyltransferase